MSKVSSVSSLPSYPSFSDGYVTVNGKKKASTKKTSEGVVANYDMSQYENQLNDYAQKTLAEIVPDINTFLPETWNAINTQVNAYTQKGVDTLNDIYNPMITSAKNDIASRFGNLDNSLFMDKLNSIENKRSDAASALTQDILAQQNSLVNDELARRYNYVGLLNTLAQQPYANIATMLGLSNNASALGNNYNANLYNALYKQALSGGGGTANSLNSLAGLAQIMSLL